ncbi:hypothetical protein [Corynebacterium appendicis]|uniref:hypothetical protein n=1 Tax=Corynebacterium appendicis TaxID=163202 RepID=UPI00254BD780|nr:hypothetical protein [Corynebacterium appendicis]MDK8625216.1 hypothetical protein [Corynebacterium appendicis]
MGLRHHDEETVQAVNDTLTQMYGDGSFDRFVAENLQADPETMWHTPGGTSFLEDAD